MGNGAQIGLGVWNLIQQGQQNKAQNKLKTRELDLEERRYDNALKMMDEFKGNNGGVGSVYNLRAPNGAAVDAGGNELQPPTPTPTPAPAQPSGIPGALHTMRAKLSPILGEPAPDTTTPAPAPDLRPGLLLQTDPSVAPAHAKGWSVNSLIPYAKPTGSFTISTSGGVSFSVHNPDTNDRRSALYEYIGYAARNGIPGEVAFNNAKMGGLAATEDDMKAVMGADFDADVHRNYARLRALGTPDGDAMDAAYRMTSDKMGWYPKGGEVEKLMLNPVTVMQKARETHAVNQQMADDAQLLATVKGAEAGAEAAGKVVGENKVLPTEMANITGKTTAETEAKNTANIRTEALNPTMLEGTGLPLGSTMSDATGRGMLKLSQSAQTEFQGFNDTFNTIGELKRLTQRIASADHGILARLAASYNNNWAAMSQDTSNPLAADLARYMSLRAFSAPGLAKAAQVNRFNLAEIGTLVGALPTFDGLTPDNLSVANAKLDEIHGKFKGAYDAWKAANTGGITREKLDAVGNAPQAAREGGATTPAQPALAPEEDRTKRFLEHLSPPAQERLFSLPSESQVQIYNLIAADRPVPTTLFDPSK